MLVPRPCPLCACKDTKEFYVHKKAGSYFHCSKCDLRFLGKEFYASTDQEKQVYLQHTNDLENPYYLDFINPVVEVSKKFITKGQSGIDYGCGYSPLLANLLTRDGYTIKSYDPMFFPKEELLQTKYDFVVCTEVVEHFKQAGQELDKLNTLLKTNGVLVLMTLLYNESIEFAHWHYRRDPTHVSLYSQKSIDYLMKKMGWTSLYSDEKRLFVFKKL
ncbi:MAG: class I SAM-dependent methyltransferase [Bdellovibrionales bacterium]|nr:class I SAM-dependent methyltransferase [Bdellovibrionales bacterium]